MNSSKCLFLGHGHGICACTRVPVKIQLFQLCLSVCRPERWDAIPEGVKAIPGVFGNLMTFITGAHACIGYRFAVTEWAFSSLINALRTLFTDSLFFGILLGWKRSYLLSFDHLTLSSLFLRPRSLGSRWSSRGLFWLQTKKVGHNCHSSSDLRDRIDALDCGGPKPTYSVSN
jgi:hypothetical protein